MHSHEPLEMLQFKLQLLIASKPLIQQLFQLKLEIQPMMLIELLFMQPIKLRPLIFQQPVIFKPFQQQVGPKFLIFQFILILPIFQLRLKLLKLLFFKRLIFRPFLLISKPEFITFFQFLILQLSMLQSKLLIFVFFVMLSFKLPNLIFELAIEIFLKQYPSNLINVSIIIQVLLSFRVQLNEPSQLEFLIVSKLNLFEFFRHKLQPLIQIFSMRSMWQLERQQARLKFWIS